MSSELGGQFSNRESSGGWRDVRLSQLVGTDKCDSYWPQNCLRQPDGIQERTTYQNHGKQNSDLFDGSYVITKRQTNQARSSEMKQTVCKL